VEQIRVDELTFSYPNSDRAALQEISLSVKRGDFLVLFGRSGCGKSTFLRQLKPVLAPFGQRKGSIEFNGQDIGALSDREQSSRIGFVSQNADNQIVTDKVWHELAFGLESLGYDSRTIRLRVAEMASFFGIEDWFYKPVTELSGGQKQILNLASVVLMQPEVLLLDEPTSQLDPIAAANFVQMLKKINDELGTTVILSEHRLEEVLPVSTRVCFMEEGRIVLDCRPREIGSSMKQLRNDMFEALPAPVKIYSEFCGGESPVTVREAKEWLEQKIGAIPREKTAAPQMEDGRTLAVELDDVWFRYERNAGDIVKGVSLKIPSGCLYSIVGGNGAGKSTLVSMIGGVNQPYRGRVKLFERDLRKVPHNERYRKLIGYLPQDSRCLFVKNTVRKDLYEMACALCGNKEEAEEQVNRVAAFFQLEALLNRHPFDLSGGEQQCAALAKVMLTDPKIILLDEPTNGMDFLYKKRIAEWMDRLKKEGKTVVLVSHDIDFCADHSDCCALMFQGEIITDAPTKPFFTGNSFYTTAANRISRGFSGSALTCEEVIALCRRCGI
jgi:ATPase components of various ABC-type transport systems, contain duplicated ATPase